MYVSISLHKIISVQLTQCAHKRCDILHMRFFIFTFFFHQLSSWSLLLGIFWFLVTKLGEFYKSSKWWKNHQKLQPCIKVLNLSSHFRHLGGRGREVIGDGEVSIFEMLRGKKLDTGKVSTIRGEIAAKGDRLTIDIFEDFCCRLSKASVTVFYANRRISSAITSKVNPLNILPSNSKRCRTIQ